MFILTAGPALLQNSRLTALHLGGNDIRRIGAVALAEVNPTILLCDRKFDSSVEALEKNSTLLSLNL